MNHTRYDRDDFNPDFPAASNSEECHVEKQFKDSKLTPIWIVLTGIGLGLLVLHLAGGL